MEKKITSDVDLVIHNYRDFLLNSWVNIKFITNHVKQIDKEEFINDFCQANWELMVESALCSSDEFLVSYGYGADSNQASSRILFPDQVPTHKITCYKIKDKIIDKNSGLIVHEETLNFDGFVNFVNNCYFFEPPYDHVLINLSTEPVILSLMDVQFTLVAMI